MHGCHYEKDSEDKHCYFILHIMLCYGDNVRRSKCKLSHFPSVLSHFYSISMGSIIRTVARKPKRSSYIAIQLLQ